MVTDFIGEKILARLRKLEKQVSCLSFNLGITVTRYVGNNSTTSYSTGSTTAPFLVSTDGRVNDPLTEYTYSSGTLTFIGAPALGSIILILSQ